MRIPKIALGLMLIMVGAHAADAATANAVFSGSILSTCVLTVGTPGVMTADSGYSGLSSDNASGVESTVSALVTGGTFNVSAIAPSAFTLGDSSNVSFVTDYTLTGAATASDVAGATTTAIPAGVTNVSVDLAATKSTGTFAAGVYAATVIVRCE